MTEKYSPRLSLMVLLLGVLLSWLVVLLALNIIYLLGRWVAEMLGWL
jgi:hypothetical protein